MYIYNSLYIYFFYIFKKKKESPVEIFDASRTLSTKQYEKALAEAEEIIKQTYSEVPNWEMLIPNLTSAGVKVFFLFYFFF